jgi:hypothetical protein
MRLLVDLDVTLVDGTEAVLDHPSASLVALLFACGAGRIGHPSRARVERPACVCVRRCGRS